MYIREELKKPLSTGKILTLTYFFAYLIKCYVSAGNVTGANDLLSKIEDDIKSSYTRFPPWKLTAILISLIATYVSGQMLFGLAFFF
jgi:hypothetical protein